ncbi:zinc-ribbon domain-containing protein [Priestia megaterium]|uniref:zinc-ribbon domain-containing protein n=1 Tax=Priestia megaterium TaxID=1404 RepID=UPI003C2B0EEB
MKNAKENILAYAFPALAKEWHPSKNGNLTPYDRTRGSSEKVWWLCDKGHEWNSVIYSRTIGFGGCPYCSGRRATEEYCLSKVKPALSKQWHPTKNKKLTPNDVTPFTHKTVWWLCDKGHEWKAKISNRSNGRNCPFCAGKKVCSDNSLQTLNPPLAKEWHPSKNEGLTPKDVTRSAEKKVWWLCDKGHEWEAYINNRARGNNCPTCNKENSTSFPEQTLFYFCQKFFPNTRNKYKVKNHEIDVYIPDLRLAIEYDGYFFHKTTKALKNDKYKTDFLIKHGYNVIRIREKGLPNINQEGLVELIYDCNREYKNFDVCIKALFNHIIENHIISEDIKKSIKTSMDGIDIPKFKNDILKTYVLSKNEKSLSSNMPELAKEWHPTKNNGLQPEQFYKGSHYKAWWRCSKSDLHEWEAVIFSRTRGHGCPFCNGRRVCTDNSLKSVNPALAKEWHSTKNEGLTPNDVTYMSRKKVWWRCKKGHEWYTRVSHRNAGSGCPFCSGNRVCEDNCLATTHPRVSKQWNYKKNKELTPYDVSFGSNKKVWWLCEKGHEWEALIYNERKRKKCPHCKN